MSFLPLPISPTVLLSVCKAEFQVVQAGLELLTILSLPPVLRLQARNTVSGIEPNLSDTECSGWLFFWFLFSLKTVSNSVVQTGLGLREILLLRPLSVGLLQVIYCLLSSLLN